MKTMKEVFTIIRDGERKRGVEMLYNNHYNKMYAIAFSIVNDRQKSENIVHNVVYKLLTMDVELFPRGGESTWLYHVIKNECINTIKHENRILDFSKISIEIEDKNIEDFVDLDEYYSMLKGLNPTQKEVVTLKVLGGYSHKEIAEIVGKRVGTVKWIFSTSIRQLRNLLAGFIPTIILMISGMIVSAAIHIDKMISIKQMSSDLSNGDTASGSIGGSSSGSGGIVIDIEQVLKNADHTSAYFAIAIGVLIAVLIIVFLVVLIKKYKKI